MYKESDKGNVLKRYKTEWYVDYQDLLSNSQNIRIIRQLRIGCSQLTSHSPYHYKNPSVCPGCNMTVDEDNYHFILKCKRYNDVRTVMINNLQLILKLQKLKPNTKTILGFPKITSDLKSESFIMTREIIWYHLGKYIEMTKRFTKPKWLIPFLKSGIG